MKLSPAVLDAHLNQLGQSVAWRRAFDCPCRNANSGAADLNCAVCKGIGVTWNAAVTGKLALAGLKIQRAWAQFGLWEDGDVVVSIPSDSPVYAIGESDRVVLSDSSIPYSVTRVHDGNDLIAFDNATVDRVFWIVNNAIVEGGIPTLSAGVPTWTTGEPPAGQSYSVTGRRSPEYFVYREYPQDRAHYGGVKLPRRVVLRSFDLYGRSGT